MSVVPSTAGEALWSAAFGEHPGTPLPTVEYGSFESWLAAVALGARGHYAAAATHLHPLIRAADPALAALAAATLASHHRQLGAHAAARPLDAHGLHRLTAAAQDASWRGSELWAQARSDVLLGLAADAVGLGRTGEARRLVAAEGAGRAAGWRAEVRRAWLRAEIALGAGEPAVAPARVAVEAARACGSVRHRAKSALVLGVALIADGLREEGRKVVDSTLRIAENHGLRPLVWPAALVLADLETDQKRLRAQAADALHCVLRHSDAKARRRAETSPWVPTWLFASAPNR
ncbi:hypothetical protein ACTG9Q_20540 [Actinokineospora sp. 24-640]